MFQATERETVILKTLSSFSNSDSKYIEETALFEFLRSAQDNAFKNALSGCVTKGFAQKSEKGGKSFYKITEDGLKQI